LPGSFIAGPAALARLGGTAPMNTDDQPVVIHRAPWLTYAPTTQARDRLMALLDSVNIAPAELFGAPSTAAAPRLPTAQDVASLQPDPARLADYWAARTAYLRAGVNVAPSPDVRVMLAQVRAPLLAVLRRSADFDAAFDPLLAMARTLARSDAVQARSLLAELLALRPARQDAARLLRQLDGAVSPTLQPAALATAKATAATAATPATPAMAAAANRATPATATVQR
jgi:spermidine synthase